MRMVRAGDALRRENARINLRVGLAVGLALALCAAAPPMVRVADAALPDGREYELVSPPDKNGADVMSVSSRTRAAGDGTAVSFSALGAFAAVFGTGIATDYLSVRQEKEWKTHGITPVQQPRPVSALFTGPGDPRYLNEFSDDLTKGVVRAYPIPGTPPNVDSAQNLFLRDDLRDPSPGSYQLLTDSITLLPVQGPNPGHLEDGYKPYLAAASEDFGHVIFQSNLNLIAGASGDLQKLYEWDHGVVRLVGVLPPSEGGGISPTAVAGRGASGINPPDTDGSISTDGSRIFFTVEETPAAGPSGLGSGSGKLYLRENGSTTVRINASEKDPADAPSPATFWTASSDGSRAFLTTAEQLTEDDNDAVVDLYVYDVGAPPGARLTRLSIDGEPEDGKGAIIGVLGASADGERIYFAGSNQLVDGMPIGGSGSYIYLSDGGDVRFVGRIADSDREPNFGMGSILYEKTSRVTPDGQHLLFRTSEGGQTVPTDLGDCGGTPCEALYLYSAPANQGAGELTCASCPQNGASPTSDATISAGVGLGGSTVGGHDNRPLSDDGRFVFFSTRDALVEQDRNTAYDTYQYNALTGELHLISTGRVGVGDAYFMDASRDGSDVFFATREQLVGWDDDGFVDLYDARVGGGFPEPMVKKECQGDACQGPLGSPPGFSEPASSTFHGAGSRGGRGGRAR